VAISRAQRVDRVVLLAVASLGCGAAPDAARFGDAEPSTLSNVSHRVGGVTLPFLQELGLGWLTLTLGVAPLAQSRGAFGKLRPASPFLSTTAGLRELVGLQQQEPGEEQEPPRAATVLDDLVAAAVPVVGVGELAGHVGARGLSEQVTSGSDAEGCARAAEALDRIERGLVVALLDDLDRLHGARRDATGFARALAELDSLLPSLTSRLGARDLLIVTSPHGQDPTAPATGPTREYVPLLVASQATRTGSRRRDLGTRLGLYDVAQTLAEGFGLPPRSRGLSFLDQVLST
jgi:phosphopentomutase